MKTQAAIASGHEQTCQVAQEILRTGGNVVDAGIAALCAMFVTEPAMASPGGGGFATICMKGQSVRFYDFFCQAPSVKKPEDQLDIRRILVDFGDDQELFFTGNGTTAVPGMLAGMYSMHAQHGSIPLGDLFQPAIQLMKEGVALDSFQYYDLSLLKDIFLSSDFGKRVFAKNGKLKGVGDTIKMPELADFLEVLSIEGKDLFYKGEAGKELVQIHHDEGGLLSREDLAEYEVEVRKPLSFTFKSNKIFTTPFPFLGGAIFYACMKMLEKVSTRKKSVFDEFYHSFSEIASYEKDPQKLKDILDNGPILPSSDHNGSTSHFSIVDEDGNAISLTTSIGEGSGLFLPGSGVHMNNMLGELALLPGGVNSWMPNVRLNSRMCPTVIQTMGKDVVALGTGGAGRIPYVLAQCIQQWQLDSKNVAWDEVLNYPRIFLDQETLHIESPLSEFDFSGIDRDIRIWSQPSMFFGGVNLATLDKGELKAAADSRRSGHIAFT